MKKKKNHAWIQKATTVEIYLILNPSVIFLNVLAKWKLYGTQMPMIHSLKFLVCAIVLVAVIRQTRYAFVGYCLQ